MSVELLQQLPAGFDLWPPAWQAAALFVSTFVLEDVAAVGAGLLLSAGVLTWPLAFGACFLGIWVGDAGLYALARLVGRNWFERTSLRRFSGRVARSERWFAERGNSILVFSRLLPGARLPTYLAAGFLRLPLHRFALVTGVASCGWTIVVLLATHLLGTSMLAWLGPLRKTGWAALLGLVVMLLLLRFAKQLVPRRAFEGDASKEAVYSPSTFIQTPLQRSGQGAPNVLHRLATRLERWRHWEFWPGWVFYPPVALYCLWLALKYRGLTLPTAANPGIFSGGIIGESKLDTLQSLMRTSPAFTAEAELLAGSTPGERLCSLREICQRRSFDYPFILKPDVGQRGAGVKLVRNEAQARAYLARTAAPLLVQRYAPGPHEAGIFYYRFPHESRGRIFAITEKVFPAVTGDGHSTVSALVWADPRARFLADTYLRRLAGRRHEVLPAGQRLKLVEAGNHAQGSIFRDGRRLGSPALAERIDSISQQVGGFFIGRYDVRYSSEPDLRAGRNFQIIELNGAASEATTIYDARNSLCAAYRTLFRQWDVVFAIGRANRDRGVALTRAALLWRKWREYSRQAATLPAAD